MQRNLQELLKQHRVPATAAHRWLRVSYQVFRMQVLKQGNLRPEEIATLATRLGTTAEVVAGCVAETKVRPERRRAGGRIHAKIDVGLGQAGYCAAPAQMSPERDFAG